MQETLQMLQWFVREAEQLPTAARLEALRYAFAYCSMPWSLMLGWIHATPWATLAVIGRALVDKLADNRCLWLHVAWCGFRELIQLGTLNPEVW